MLFFELLDVMFSEIYVINWYTNFPLGVSLIYLLDMVLISNYCCLDPKTNQIYTTHHTIFDENVFPFNGILTLSNQATMVLTKFDDPLTCSIPIITLPPPPCGLCHGQPPPLVTQAAMSQPIGLTPAAMLPIADVPLVSSTTPSASNASPTKHVLSSPVLTSTSVH